MTLGEDPNLEITKFSDTLRNVWKKVKEKISWPGWPLPTAATPHVFLAVVFVLVLFVFIVLVFASPSTPATVQANNTLHKIEQCIDAQRSDLLDDDIVLRNLCATKYAVEVDQAKLTGRGGYHVRGMETIWKGTLVNESTHIITAFQIIVTYKEKKETWSISDQWIEPGGSYQAILVGSKNLPTAYDVHNKLLEKGIWSWSTPKVMGVPIVD